MTGGVSELNNVTRKQLYHKKDITRCWEPQLSAHCGVISSSLFWSSAYPGGKTADVSGPQLPLTEILVLKA